MPKVPFLFTATVDSTHYGSIFDNADATFTGGKKNEILSALAALSPAPTPASVGIFLPASTKAFVIRSVSLYSSDSTHDLRLGWRDVTNAVSPILMSLAGPLLAGVNIPGYFKVLFTNDEVNGRDGWSCPAGALPFITTLNASATGQVIEGLLDYVPVV